METGLIPCPGDSSDCNGCTNGYFALWELFEKLTVVNAAICSFLDIFVHFHSNKLKYNR